LFGRQEKAGLYKTQLLAPSRIKIQQDQPHKTSASGKAVDLVWLSTFEHKTSFVLVTAIKRVRHLMWFFLMDGARKSAINN
jgi:hypothetical protein